MRKTSFILGLSLLLASAPIVACSDGDNDDNNSNNSSNNNGNGNSDKKEFVKFVNSSAEYVKASIDEDSLSSFVNGQYDLNFEILRAAADDLNDNAMISTFSIQAALAMTWAGADGKTATEMASTLHFDSKTHEALNKINGLLAEGNKEAVETEAYRIDAAEIKTSNNLYLAPQYTWQSDWLDLLAKEYKTGVYEMDFASDPEKARTYINKTVSDDTHERITDLLPNNSITARTRAVITNAIYFKSPWQSTVHSIKMPMSFKKLDNSTVDASALETESKFEYMKDDAKGFQALSVPLRDADFKIMFILPDENKFNDIEDSLNGSFISSIFAAYSTKTVSLSFPGFSYHTSLQLSKPLKALGMKDAFSVNADFSKLTVEANELSIDEVYHKTFIGVDEKGVEAAAATAVVVAENSAPSDIISVTLNRPFYYVIYESETHSPLFVGRVLDPSKQD